MTSTIDKDCRQKHQLKFHSRDYHQNFNFFGTLSPEKFMNHNNFLLINKNTEASLSFY